MYELLINTCILNLYTYLIPLTSAAGFVMPIFSKRGRTDSITCVPGYTKYSHTDYVRIVMQIM